MASKKNNTQALKAVNDTKKKTGNPTASVKKEGRIGSCEDGTGSSSGIRNAQKTVPGTDIFGISCSVSVHGNQT